MKELFAIGMRFQCPTDLAPIVVILGDVDVARDESLADIFHEAVEREPHPSCILPFGKSPPTPKGGGRRKRWSLLVETLIRLRVFINIYMRGIVP